MCHFLICVETVKDLSRPLDGFPQHYTLNLAVPSCPAPGGRGGGDFGFQEAGMIEWGKNQNPKKYLDQKLSAKKSNAQFPSLKNSQKALNDNYNTQKYNHLEIN